MKIIYAARFNIHRIQDNAPSSKQGYLAQYTTRYKIIFQRMRKIPDTYKKQLEIATKEQIHTINAIPFKCNSNMYHVKVNHITKFVVIFSFT